MMHRTWSSIVEVPYCFSRAYVKFQGHTALKIFEFDPNWAFPDCNSSLNSPMAMKCCTKLETAKERCPIVFQVIHQISRSHGTKHHRFWPKWGVSGLQAGRSFQIPQICLVIQRSIRVDSHRYLISWQSRSIPPRTLLKMCNFSQSMS